jgi:hypothetical protein
VREQAPLDEREPQLGEHARRRPPSGDLHAPREHAARRERKRQEQDQRPEGGERRAVHGPRGDPREQRSLEQDGDDREQAERDVDRQQRPRRPRAADQARVERAHGASTRAAAAHATGA